MITYQDALYYQFVKIPSLFVLWVVESIWLHPLDSRMDVVIMTVVCMPVMAFGVLLLFVGSTDMMALPACLVYLGGE